MRCESPSTFLGTCLSHHSFIIFLVTNTNTLLSDLYLISTIWAGDFAEMVYVCSVNDLSGLYLISTGNGFQIAVDKNGGVNALSGLYLISTSESAGIVGMSINESVNALSGLYLISTVPLQKPRFYAVSRACFCSHLSEYSGNSRFPCMLTFWTYLMRYTYP